MMSDIERNLQEDLVTVMKDRLKNGRTISCKKAKYMVALRGTAENVSDRFTLS